MPTQVHFAGQLTDDDGNFLSGAAVVVVDAGTSTSRGTDTTDANGQWDITPSGGGPQYDVTITHNGKVIRWSGRDQAQAESVQAVSPTAGEYAGAFTSTEDAASVEVALFEGDRATMADGDEAYISYSMSDDGGNQEEVARVTFTQNDVNPSADGGYKISVAVAGSLTDAIDASVSAAGVLTIALGNGVVSVTGGQLAFPASQNASAGANTLDDYEEGTWTPGIADDTGSGSSESQTYSRQLGFYTKIGNVVFFRFRLTVTSFGSLTTTEQGVIVGLPFTSSATSSNVGTCHVGLAIGLAITASMNVGTSISGNGTTIPLRLWDATTGNTVMLLSELTSDMDLIGSGHYPV